MEKDGLTWSALTWLILALIILIVVIIVLMLISGRGNTFIEALHDFLRFGA